MPEVLCETRSCCSHNFCVGMLHQFHRQRRDLWKRWLQDAVFKRIAFLSYCCTIQFCSSHISPCRFLLVLAILLLYQSQTCLSAALKVLLLQRSICVRICCTVLLTWDPGLNHKLAEFFPTFLTVEYLLGEGTHFWIEIDHTWIAKCT